MNDEQIKHMVNRFLGWRLPENFNPDCGISFDPIANRRHPTHEFKREPSGTNLFDADQAEAMVCYLAEGLPELPVVKAARELLEAMSDTFTARNGRKVGIEGDDGEKCWIVHSDQIEALRACFEAVPLFQHGEC